MKKNAFEHDLDADQRLDTGMMMEVPDGSRGLETKPAAWECELPDNTYLVTVAVGDAWVGTTPESHTINVDASAQLRGSFPAAPPDMRRDTRRHPSLPTTGSPLATIAAPAPLAKQVNKGRVIEGGAP